MPLRPRIAHHLMRLSLRLTRPPLTIEGIAMATILARLAALEAAQAAHADTMSDFATKQDLAGLASNVDGLSHDVQAIKDEIGTDDVGDASTTSTTAAPSGSY